MRNFLLYIIPAIIWGSTWLAIKFQLGKVDPMVSVAYRFAAASFILLVYSTLAGLNMRFSHRDHQFLIMQGLLLFGMNYWFVYMAEIHLTSGLVALVFSTIVFWNIFNGALLLKTPIQKEMIIGALVGFVGVALVFKDELWSFSFSRGNSVSLLIALASSYMASLGNIISARNHKYKLPVVQTTAFAMLYGAAFMAAVSLLTGKAFDFDFSFPYVSSLLYLALFGSVIAFGSYLTLIGAIGADKAGYVTLLIPMLALVLSTFFEDYHWTALALTGVVFILGGNLLIVSNNLRKRKVLQM